MAATRTGVMLAAVALGCASGRAAPPPANAGAAASAQPPTVCGGGVEIPNQGGDDVARPPLCVTHASLSRKGNRQYGRWSNDDRVRVTHGGLLLAVADASDPVRGGYLNPIALDPGLDALEQVVRPAVKKAPCTESCVSAAFDAANTAMYALQTAFNPIFEEELAKVQEQAKLHPAAAGLDRGEAARRAWERVARARLGRVDVDGHPQAVTVAASVTTLVFDSGRATIGQIGTARAYRCRDGGVEQLLRDQSLNPDARLSGSYGNRAYGLASARLGAGPTAAVLTRSVHVQAGDRFVLVTDGVWTTVTDADVARACAGASAPEIVAAIDAAAREATDDVTIAVAIVSTGR